MKTNTDEDGFFRITVPQGAYEIKSLNKEIMRIIVEKDHYKENEYPFTIKPNFSTLGSIIEIMPQGPIIKLIFDDSIRDF